MHCEIAIRKTFVIAPIPKMCARSFVHFCLKSNFASDKAILTNNNDAYILEFFCYVFPHRAFHRWRRVCNAAHD